MAYSGKLIRSGNNAKTVKGDDEYETAIMYLAPFTLSGFNVCAMASVAGCPNGCLNIAGRGIYSNVQLARINKTKRYTADRRAFMTALADDIAKFVRYCERKGVKPAIRLNGTSDIQWEVAHPVEIVEPNGDLYRFASIFELFPQVQFYDYTKIYKRAYRSLPSNYSLTLSYSEANSGYADKIIETAKDTGLNIAVVYRTKELRDGLVSSGGDHLQGAVRMTNRPVFNGDKTDLRFTDPTGVIVGLFAKGPAKKDTSGFVVG